MRYIRTWLENYVARTAPELLDDIAGERDSRLSDLTGELEERSAQVAGAEARIAELERRLAAVGTGRAVLSSRREEPALVDIPAVGKWPKVASATTLRILKARGVPVRLDGDGDRAPWIAAGLFGSAALAVALVLLARRSRRSTTRAPASR